MMDTLTSPSWQDEDGHFHQQPSCGSEGISVHSCLLRHWKLWFVSHHFVPHLYIHIYYICLLVYVTATITNHFSHIHALCGF